MKKYTHAFVIGRFQPLHLGHCHLITSASKIADKVIVLVGSANASPSPRNPFTYDERRIMIEGFFGSTVKVRPLNDHYYNDDAWIKEVQDIVRSFTPFIPVIVGHDKDSTSYYLKLFPNYPVEMINNHEGINATDIRHTLFSGGIWEKYLPIDSIDVISNCRNLNYLSKEYWDNEEYKAQFSDLPYPPVFTTVDAIIVCSGHVLLVERKYSPGKGLMALPGGFINQDETLLSGAIRELREETGLKMPAQALQKCDEQHVFDHPDRSMRGRTITHGFFWHLSPGKLPEVRGRDDALKAVWVPLAEVDPTEMFEDHYHIIRYFLR